MKHGEFMMTYRLATCAVALLLLQAYSAPVCADIYKFEDADGVIHFTDAPTDRRFKVFMRDIQKDKRLRTNFGFGKLARNPAEFDHIIDSCAAEFGVDRALVKAVIHAESGYNPQAVSSKGATGLMQLMPGTAHDLKVADAFNPTDNIRGGVRYLRFLLDTFKGNVSLALAAYNAGLAKVAKYGGVPPYNETRNYVSKVLNYQRNYASN
jgi:hypothetical protein